LIDDKLTKVTVTDLRAISLKLNSMVALLIVFHGYIESKIVYIISSYTLQNLHIHTKYALEFIEAYATIGVTHRNPK
jgi:hypothetical protein